MVLTHCFRRTFWRHRPRTALRGQVETHKHLHGLISGFRLSTRVWNDADVIELTKKPPSKIVTPSPATHAIWTVLMAGGAIYV